jgi:hypothetical protein
MNHNRSPAQLRPGVMIIFYQRKDCVIFREGKEYGLNDIVEMKKQHPCGTNAWKIIRMGADIRIKCEGCGHSVMIPRNEFSKKMKKVLVKAES